MRAVLAARLVDPISAAVITIAGLLSGVLIAAMTFALAPSSAFPTARHGDWIIQAIAPAAQQPQARAETPAPQAQSPALQPPLAQSAAPKRSLAAAAAPAPAQAPVKTRPAVGEAAFAARWSLAAAETRPADPDTAPTGSIRLALAEEAAPTLAPAPFPRVPAEATRIKPLVRKADAPEKRAVNPMDEVDRYLWQVYERAPVKKDNSGDFTWKDPAAAKRMHISLKAYVIGGMEPDFREQLYHAGRAMDAAGLHWSMLSAFRDDYRQALAAGFKARPGNSLHGGSRAVGGYGHGRAIDVMNTDRDDEAVWHWLDAHGAKYGLRRPMPGYDPAHIQAGGAWHEIAQSLRASRARLAEKAKAPNTVATRLKDARTAM